MFFTRVFCAGIFVCLSLPAWAGNSPDAPHSAAPSLQTFIQQIWAESPTVQAAQAQFEAAQALREGANRPLHNPSLEFDTERTDINTSSVGFSQTIDWSDKQGAQVRIATREQQAAQAAFLQVRRSTALEALNALVDFFTAREMQTLSQRRTQLMKAFVDTARQRQAAGDMRALDVTLAQVAYSEALMTMASTASELAEAQAALQAVSGLTQTQWPPLPNALAAPPKHAAFSVLDKLPEMAVLRSRMDAARARVSLAQKQGRIDPTVGIRAGREDSETLLGLSLEIPLFVRNNFGAQTRAASHLAIAEEQTYRDAYRRAKARLSGTLARYQNTRQAWFTWLDVGSQAQQEQMSLLDQMWQAGELSVTEYLIQAKQNIDTQEAATALMGEARRAHFAWLAASNQVEDWLGLAQHDIETNSGESK